jgi:ribulose bisphosphate carboxylase small subunit
MTTNPNIRFAYMYRDASNYKQHGEVIFSNEKQLSVNEIEKQIRSFLNDGEYFIARQIHLEERFFDTLYDDDHPWHEFVRLEATDDLTFDPEPELKRDIAEFLVELENAHRAGWDEMNVREDLARQLSEQKRALKQRLESGAESLP